MPTPYRITRGAHAQSTTADSATIDVPAGRLLIVNNISVVGMASALAAGAEIGLFRTTANGSGGTPTSITIKPVDPNGASVPSGFTAKFGYTTQPTVETDPLWRGNFQPAGGRAAPPATPLIFWSATAYQVSLRGISGTPNVAFDMDVELW